MGGDSGHHCLTSSRMAPSLACLPPWNRSPFFTTALAKTKLSNVSSVSTFPNDQPMLKSTQLNQAKQCIVASCQQCTAVANHNVRHNVRPMRSMQQPTSRPGICQHFKFQHTLALKANDQELWSGAPLPMWIAHTGSPSTFSWCPQHLQGGLFLRHCLNEIGVLAKQPSVSSRYGSTASPRGPDPHHPTDSCPKRLRKGKCDGRALDMLNGSQLKIHNIYIYISGG